MLDRYKVVLVSDSDLIRIKFIAKNHYSIGYQSYFTLLNIKEELILSILIVYVDFQDYDFV